MDTATLGMRLVTAALALPLSGVAVAESMPDRASLGLRVLDYKDSQTGADRVAVRTGALALVLPVAGDWAIGATLTTDGISGASPAYHTTALTKLRDRRNAADTEATRYFSDGSLTFGASFSSERDYVSRGLSARATHESEDKATTWSAGAGFNADRIDPSNHSVQNERKRVGSLMLGVTQVMTARDLVQINLGLVRGRGYLSDPYKIFDQRPQARHSHTLLARWNHHFDASSGTARLAYRYFGDSWEIRAHTWEAEYVQALPAGWTVAPLVRFYTQSKARFYVEADPASAPFPTNPPPNARTFSEDQRVSAFGAHTFGIKLAKKLTPDWSVDLKFEQYRQRGAWTLFGDGSRGLAPFKADALQVGILRQF